MSVSTAFLVPQDISTVLSGTKNAEMGVVAAPGSDGP